MIVARLALQSLRNRWLTAMLTVLAIAMSVMLLIGVEVVRGSARSSFASTISGTDLVVGARSGGMQLLLYSVFHIGNATNNVTWKSFSEIAGRSEVAWSVPLSLGDSHRGYRVIGTTPDFFEHYQFRNKQSLSFASGKSFEDLFNVVVGADVAQQLGYKIGDSIVIAHGIGSLGPKHDDLPFRVSGILNATGTPVDKSLLVSLEAIEAIHVDWRSGSRIPGMHTPADQLREMHAQPKAITAALIGLKSRLQVFGFQRYVNNYRAEPLSAIMPGVALQEMWDLLGVAENALFIISGLVAVTALLGMATMIMSSLAERRREIAILRSIGAGPRTVVGMLLSEAAFLTAAGIAVGLGAFYLAIALARPFIDRKFGLLIDIAPPSQTAILMLLAIFAGGVTAGLMPAIRAYRLSIADGMTVRT